MNSDRPSDDRPLFRLPLAALLADGVLQVPGVYDALSARVAQAVGCKAVAVSGNALSASQLGLPDMGILTMSEMVEQTRRIVQAVDIPVIADADTGYGGTLNIIRTVREYESVGVAAIHLEDQVLPKRCAYLPGELELVTIDEQRRRLVAALKARSRPEMLIIARTDASGTVEEILRRCKAYAAVGVDWLFCAKLQSLDEARLIASEIGIPLMVNLNLAGALKSVTVAELQAANVAIALYPSVVRNTVVKAVTDNLATLLRTGSQAAIERQVATSQQYDQLLDTAHWQQLELSLGGPHPVDGQLHGPP